MKIHGRGEDDGIAFSDIVSFVNKKTERRRKKKLTVAFATVKYMTYNWNARMNPPPTFGR